MSVMHAMDAALGPPLDELELPTTRPFGHFVACGPGRAFCIVSEARGALGYFMEADLAQPFLRMLVRNAWHSKGRLDFRLWRWNAAASGWETAQRTIRSADAAASGWETAQRTIRSADVRERAA